MQTTSSRDRQSVTPKGDDHSLRKIRKIQSPAKPGTIKPSVIRKAIRELMAERAARS